MVGVRRGLREERLVLARGAGGVAHADRPDRHVDVLERDALVRAVAHLERDDRGERREAAAALTQAQVHRRRRAVGAQRAHRQLALHHDVSLARTRDPGRAGAEPRLDALAGTEGPTPCSRGGRARGSAPARARSLRGARGPCTRRATRGGARERRAGRAGRRPRRAAHARARARHASPGRSQGSAARACRPRARLHRRRAVWRGQGKPTPPKSGGRPRTIATEYRASRAIN